MDTESMSRKRRRPSLVRKVDALVRREGMLPPGSRVLVMVSGGQDSIALLHVLASGRLSAVAPMVVFALHVNHHLRGAESDADESLVTETCARLGVDLNVVNRPIDKTLGNVQEAARNARRSAATELAGTLECGTIALGHTADDQVETLLYRAARYGGLSALAGMRPCDPPWIRPLLDCRREETAAYCRENGLDFARDSGNYYPGYARTQIRESVLPAWEAAMPGAVEAACRTAEVAAELKGLAAEVLARAVAEVQFEDYEQVGHQGLARGRDTVGDANVTTLRCDRVLALSTPVRRLLLHEWLSVGADSKASRAAVLAVESLLAVSGSAVRSLEGGRRAVKEYDLIRIEGATEPPSDVPGPTELPVPGRARWGSVEVTSEYCEGFRAVEVHREAIVDADTVSGVLQVRGPQPGDRVRPLGATGSRKLKEIFVDNKVPSRERPWRPLVVCGERIVWVGGILVADDVKVTDRTRRFLRLSFELSGEE